MLNQTRIERIITAPTGEYIHSHRHAQKVKGDQHHRDMGQVGAMVFAVAEREPAILRDILVTAGSGIIYVYGAGGKVIDAQDVLVERSLAGSPVGVVTEGKADIRQVVIGHVGSPQWLWRHGAECGALVGLGAHTTEPMVRTRQDVAQPDGHEPAQAHPQVLAVSGEVCVHEGGQTPYVAYRPAAAARHPPVPCVSWGTRLYDEPTQ